MGCLGPTAAVLCGALIWVALVAAFGWWVAAGVMLACAGGVVALCCLDAEPEPDTVPREDSEPPRPRIG